MKHFGLLIAVALCMATVLGLCACAVAENTITYQGITFQEWDKPHELPDNPGEYYLKYSVKIYNSPWNVPSGTTKLYLNGNSITMGSNLPAISVGTGCTLDLYDKSGNPGQITHSNNIVSIENSNSSGVLVYGGTFNMHGGAICGNTCSVGGGVHVQQGSFNMYGGIICGNTASQGGGVYISSETTFTMEGGTIRGNNAESAGGGVFSNGTFNIIGSPVITGNYKGSQRENVRLVSGKMNVTGHLKNAAVGITVSGDNKIFTSGYGSDGYNNGDDPSKYFFSDDDNNWYVTFDQNQKEAKLETGAHQHESVTFQPWNDEAVRMYYYDNTRTAANSLPSSGDYYLTEDVTISENWNPSDTVHLCLNGHQIKMDNNDYTIYSRKEFHLYDCRHEGCITHEENQKGGASAARVGNR